MGKLMDRVNDKAARMQQYAALAQQVYPDACVELMEQLIADDPLLEKRLSAQVDTMVSTRMGQEEIRRQKSAERNARKRERRNAQSMGAEGVSAPVSAPVAMTASQAGTQL